MSKTTDEFKMYLNSILNKIDDKIHNEIWNKLIEVILEQEQVKMIEGKCPKDNRSERPVFIITNNKRTLVIADGKGDCYMVEGLDFYKKLDTKCLPKNKVNPDDYEFERGLNGFDF